MSIVKDTGWRRNVGSQERDEKRFIQLSSPDEHSDGAHSDYGTELRFFTYEQKENPPATSWRGHANIKGLGEVFRCYAPSHDEVKKKLDAGMLALGVDLVKTFGPAVVVVALPREDALFLADELRGALSFAEKAGFVRPGEDGPKLRELLAQIDKAVRY
jgi:hypothetical protein